MTPATTTPILLESSGLLDNVLIRICIGLQLTPTQYAAAVSHYRGVAEWLVGEGSSLSGVRQEVFPQGSLRIGTTVKPRGRDEYDLDLVLWLDLPPALEPAELLSMVERRLRDHGTYASKVERKNRCIRLNFAGQFHLDALPALPDQRFPGTEVLVPDREDCCWKESNPKGFAKWFDLRGAQKLQESRLILSARTHVEPVPIPEEAADKNALQLVVQLLKRWRDIHFEREPDLAPISIVLTTLAASHHYGLPRPLEALEHVVASVVGSIPRVGRLVVLNPTNPLEDLSERWDENPEAYVAFVRAIRGLNRDLGRLRSAADLETRTRLLEELFGEGPARRALLAESAALQQSRSGLLLGVAPASAALVQVASPRSVPVRPNNFYGE